MAAEASDARQAGLALGRDGAVHLASAALGNLAALDALAGRADPARAGIRLIDPALHDLVEAGSRLHAVAADRLGHAAQAVRAVLFDKSDAANWALGWHQDRTILVRERHDVDGFGPWTVKAGLLHVAPPFSLLARMVTMRVHLDPVTPDNAPLLIVPGSHRLGRLSEIDLPGTVAHLGTLACLAERGDVWLYATPIVHASARAARGQRRRVLQIDFAAESLPAPLAWRGIGA